MKTLLSLLFFIGSLTFALGQSNLAKVNSSEISQLKDKGIATITLPSNLPQEEVDANSKYYTRMFTVDYDETSHKATINMVDNTSKSRYVIIRFLSACDVDNVKVGNSTLSIKEFGDQYLK